MDCQEANEQGVLLPVNVLSRDWVCPSLVFFLKCHWVHVVRFEVNISAQHRTYDVVHWIGGPCGVLGKSNICPLKTELHLPYKHQRIKRIFLLVAVRQPKDIELV